MSFPQSPVTFLQAVNPSTAADIANIQTYQGKLQSGNFADAADYLEKMPNGTAMNINAGRFKQIIDEITAIENFYFGLGGVKEYIDALINAYSIIEEYDATTTYPQGAIAEYNGQWFKSLQDNNLGNTPTDNIGTYWSYFIQPQPAKQYPIASSQPVGLSNGDLWFRTI